MTSEITRLFPLDRLGEQSRFVVQAAESELAPLAKRMGLPAVHAFTCRFDLRRETNGSVRAHGQLDAAIAQICVISLEPFDATLVEPFEVVFVPAGQERDDLDLEAPDEIPYEGGALDLGEAAMEQLALSLDPFPRSAGATLPPTDDDAQDATGPFRALGRLRQRG